MKLRTQTLINWMSYIRQCTNPSQQFRVLENFWDTQLNSKEWLLDTIDMHLWQRDHHKNVMIYGGWYGTLGQLLYDRYERYINGVYSVDIDPQCSIIGQQLNQSVNYITGDMATILPILPCTMIINTSTEHVTQPVYDAWLKNMPSDVPIILQGNNFYDCSEHVRCTNSLHQFKEFSGLSNIIYEGELDCWNYTRFMIIGNK